MIPRLLVASVWLVHGLYNKLLGGSARHLAIVQSVPGLEGNTGEAVLTAVGFGEVALAVWIVSARAPLVCATVQTIVLLTMNAVELTFARHLLLWPAGLVPLNGIFLGLAWVAACSPRGASLRTQLRRHPIPMRAELEDCLTLAYAVPAERLTPLLPPGLELETLRGCGFVAVALVRARSLRPSGLPSGLGQDFFLSGYRVFTTFRQPGGRIIRGLRILRSDADRAAMVTGGNLLTHYHYHRCDARVDVSANRLDYTVRSDDGAADLDVTADLTRHNLPAGSPFASVREARRFAGPLPFTFDYERETHSIVAINGRRMHWQPAPVSVDVRAIGFFDQPAFAGCTPILAAAFHVRRVSYRWERGVRYALDSATERLAS